MMRKHGGATIAIAPRSLNVGLGSINISPERLRALRDDTVRELAESMKDNGLLQPIVLRPRGTAGYWLVAGHHRFEAARKLKWESHFRNNLRRHGCRSSRIGRDR